MDRLYSVIFILGIFAAFVSKSEQFTITDEHVNPEHYATKLAGFLVRRLAAELRQNSTTQLGKDAEYVGISSPELIELFPNIPLSEGRLDFENLLLKGAYEYSETKLEGFNTICHDLLFGTHPLFITYAIGFSDLGIRGNYIVDVGINLTYIEELFAGIIPTEDLPEGQIASLKGRGNYELTLQEFNLNASLTFVEVDGKVDSVSSGLEFGLGALRIYFQDMVFNEIFPFENFWGLVNILLRDFVLELLVDISERLTSILNLILSGVFKGCVVEDLVNGNFWCILLPEPTTITTAATTTTTSATTCTSVPTTTTVTYNLTTTTKSAASRTFIQSIMILGIVSALTILY